MNPYPFIAATFGIAAALIFGYSLRLLWERRKLRDLEAALKDTPASDKGAA